MINLITKNHEKITGNVEVDFIKYDLMVFKSKELINEIDQNFIYIMLRNDNEIKNFAFKLIKKYDLNYDVNSNFVNFLQLKEEYLIINGIEYEFSKILSEVFDEKIENYIDLSLKIYEVLKRKKNI